MSRAIHNSQVVATCLVRIKYGLVRIKYGLVAALLLWTAGSAKAQDFWDVSPYRILAWIALDHSSGFTLSAQQELATALARRSRATVGAPWKLQVELAPTEHRDDLLHRIDALTAEEVLACDERMESFDKFMLIAIRDDAGELTARVRQLDCRTHTWGPTVQRSVGSIHVMTDRIVQAAVAGFMPVAQIEDFVDGKLRIRMCAGRLATSGDSPALVQPGAVMQPVSRVQDRSGKTVQGGVRPMTWTVLSVASVQDSIALCDVESGFARPFAGKRSRRVERLAVFARPTNDQTVLKLASRKENAPLSGYSIYEKRGEESALLGETDWRGEITILRTDAPIRTVYVRSGNKTLAKLPLIPGLDKQLVATMADDRGRAEIEAFLIGIQDQLVDLVVRREVLANKVKNAIADEDWEVATETVSQLKLMETKADVTRRVSQFRQRHGNYDRRTQDQVDQLFAETEKLLGNHLNPQRVIELEQQLAAARQRQ